MRQVNKQILQIKTDIKEMLLENNFTVQNCDRFGKIKGAFGLKVILNEKLINWIGILIPINYPYAPCSLYIDKSNFLKIPHVEGDGRLCLGLKYHLGDEIEILSQIKRAFLIFSNIVDITKSTTTTNEEFKKEIITWWRLFSFWHDKNLKKVYYMNNYIIKPELSNNHFCLLSSTCSKMINSNNPNGFKEVQIIVAKDSDIDSLELLNKNFVKKSLRPTIINGSGIFIKIPNVQHWGPTEWPRNFNDLSKELEHFNVVEELKIFISSLSKSIDIQILKNDLISFFAQLGIKDKPTKKQILLLKEFLESSKEFLVVFEHNEILFGYQIEINNKLPFNSHRVSPILNLDRIDTNWLINRDSNKTIVNNRENKNILIIGVGAIGGNLVNLLVKSGIRKITVVDKDILKPENITRHQLGIESCGYYKVLSLKEKMEESFPLVEIKYEIDNIQNLPLTSTIYRQKYDLIIDCSAEQTVRSFLWKKDSYFVAIPKIHIWLEPFCLAGHVAVVSPNEPWPKGTDPIDSIINTSNVSIEHTEIKTPSCGGSFSPYEISDVNQVTALASKVILKSLDIGLENESYVVSLVKNISAYNEKELTEIKYQIKEVVSRNDNELQKTIKRTFKELKI